MIKKAIVTLISISLLSGGYFASGAKKDSTKKDNHGKKQSSDVNHGQQGKKKRAEHASSHASANNRVTDAKSGK